MSWQLLGEDRREWRLPNRPLDESFQVIRVAIWEYLLSQSTMRIVIEAIDGGVTFIFRNSPHSVYRFTLVCLPPEMIIFRRYTYIVSDPIESIIEIHRMERSIAGDHGPLIFAAAQRRAMQMLGTSQPDVGYPAKPRNDEGWRTIFDWREIYRPDLNLRHLAEQYNTAYGTVRNKYSELGYADMNEAQVPRITARKKR